MKKAVLIFLLFLIVIPLAQAQNISQITETKVTISNEITSQSSIEIDLYLFPRNTNVQSAKIITQPTSSIEESIYFDINERGEVSFNLISNVTNTFNNPMVTSANLISELEANKSIYSKPTEHIDSNDLLIKNKAQQIQKESKTDIEFLHNLADYVKQEMYYTLSYTQPQKASWILENKVGVCSHYTTLFIALARASGFASRYISGLAYSNENGDYVEHAWAEVFLDNYGWIPYDITFGQYGWLDSKHIVLKYGKDSAESSIEYQYTRDIQPGELKIKTRVIEEIGKVEIPFKIDLELEDNEVKQGSYVPLKVTIKNENSFYFSLPVYLQTAPGIYGDNLKIPFLEPGKETSFFFILSIPQLKKCESGCSGNIRIVDEFGNTAETRISFSEYFPKITLKQAEEIIAAEEQKSKFDFFCKTDREFYYENETMVINCYVYSEKKEDFKVCLNECEYFEDTNFTTVEFIKKVTSVSCPKILQNEKVEEKTCLNVDVINRPEVEITNINPNKVKYGETLEINLSLTSNSNFPATIIFIGENLEKEVEIKRGENLITLEVSSLHFDIGTHEEEILVEYAGRQYKDKAQESFLLTIEEVGFFKRILLFFNKLVI